ncbi:efflux RND transporter periplasmic adaptor subunit [Sphingobacteriaceae bacterium WQ 2009]|uniref:Efflux RND transporter periplasmic adaptor subunit n=1 Tax=Rhinopithecimicrobium faecis TaxID=2820698 RepID=A0A8T4H8W3_9SPHI|nr:efflux RND transporter periplasmic adaptor subunit [Sphingobacteriaceae bacterium WQ 2009]
MLPLNAKTGKFTYLLKACKGISFALFLLAVCSCQGGLKQREAPAADSLFCLPTEFKPLLQTISLKKRPVMEQLNFVGQVSYNENEVASISPTLSGAVQAVYVDLGDYVKKGQLLASIKSTAIHDLAQEQQQNSNALVGVQQRLKRQQSMLEDGLIAAAEIEETQVALKNLQAAGKQLAKNTNFYNALPAQGIFEVRAPKDGFIVEKSISPGQTLEALQEPIFVLSNLHEVWVMVNIHVRDLNAVTVGAEVQVETVAFPDSPFSGKIAAISNVFNQDEHVLKAKVVLSNTALKLKPGMSAEIQLLTPHAQEELIAIPNSHIIFYQNKHFVLRYKDDCHIEKIAVVAAYKNNEYSYVKEGFEVGDRLISANELLIFEALNSH